MKKQDLETGMTVELRDGRLGKVLLNTPNGDVIVILDEFSSSWSFLEDWDDNLDIEAEELAYLDIMKIYYPIHMNKYLETNLRYHKLIWQREEKKYYLKDNFLNQDNNDYGYLNFEMEGNTFCLLDAWGTNLYKTKFTDKEIEELKIPIERFEKIECEEEELYMNRLMINE